MRVHGSVSRVLLGLLLAAPLAAAAPLIQWGTSLHHDRAEVDVASRRYTDEPRFFAPGTAYAFLGFGRPTELARQTPVSLTEDEASRVVNVALQQRGFKAAQDRAEVTLGIIVAYGTGALRPPYAFFRIDPDFEYYRSWPTALQRLHRWYYAGSSDDDEIDRVETAEPVNYIKITAYDFRRFVTEKTLHPVWATLITMPARDRPLPEQFAAMVALAAPMFGLEARDGRTFSAETPRGNVQIGPVREVPAESTPPAVDAAGNHRPR